MKSITITAESDGKLSMSFGESISFTDALLMICSLLRQMAFQTAESAAANVVKEHKLSRKEKNRVKSEAAADIADMINMAVSNILEELSPKDPDLELSEEAIILCENEIIAIANAEHISIKDATKLYNDRAVKKCPTTKKKSDPVATETGTA